MSYTVTFEGGTAEIDEVGGKGSNLVQLSRAGFQVPPGHIVTTNAYQEFIKHNNLAKDIAKLLAGIDYADYQDVDAKTAMIRELLTQAETPDAVASEIQKAYSDLGGQTYVAVRSSGTAEDLADASFSGQHDSYLDVLGESDVLDAVRRCWASLWTARATTYRQHQGFDQAAVSIAVVIQTMVASRVSGVMFTANPMTTATNEIVVNASYGLGEGIVSGILTPDLFVLRSDTLRLKSREIGAKELQVVRNSDGPETVTIPVPPEQAAVASITEAELIGLGELGRQVARHYDDIPQDIEWGIVDGTIYLLQSRDITGVDFSWDEDITRWNDIQPPSPDDTIWSRKMADTAWNGKKTPLGNSVRDEHVAPMMRDSHLLWGLEDAAQLRPLKYWKGEVYYNSKVEYLTQRHLMPTALRRAELMQFSPETWLADLRKEPFSWMKLFKAFVRVRLMDPNIDPINCWRFLNHQMESAEGKAAGNGLSDEEIHRLSDGELKRYLDSRIKAQKEWVQDLWTPFAMVMPLAMATLMAMVENWYKGDNAMIFADLITGLPEPTITLIENVELWKLTEIIRGSERLTELFENHPDGEFFTVLEDDDEGREFLTRYREFLKEFAFRGHSDRDLYHARRIEDPAIDYRNFRALLTAESASPDATLDELVARREASEQEMIEHIRRQPLSAFKVEAFKIVSGWLLRFWKLRDDERHHTDRIQYSKKRAVHEINRRLVARGLLSGDDIYFLGKAEVYELLDGKPPTRLTTAKIAGRRRDFEAIYDTYQPPLHLRGDVPVEIGEESQGSAEDGVFRGVGTSRGTVTGVARIVPTQQDIGRVQKGDIMIATSTDPGWTSVFLVISGLVLETGGVLAHGSNISREYGIPAVQLVGARKLIKDGSTISVNGDTGEVRVLGEPEDDVTSEPVEAAAEIAS